MSSRPEPSGTPVPTRSIARDGFDATTVDDIVAEAGCSQRTFFRHFASKEDVVFHDLSDRLNELVTQLAQVPDGTAPWPAVRDVMRSLTRQFTDTDPSLTAVRIRLWFTEPVLYARWPELSREWESELAGFLTARRHADDSDFDLDSEVTAAALVVSLRAAWRGEVLHGGVFDELVGQALDLLDRGLGRESGS